ncbi:hypothetical protein AZE42_00267 [Rhizopogon vesiculosus]|uniref:Uncharacterized protein n=1 Tax=Rhizopogon vesiculosus TaxID=180088 RepID=A0A1J8QB41_9AGAM|nr:hypothetical protein AZE42_00267 [Rhizopogon vesiculosus]
MSYPLHWLKTTFSSRTRTAELLQPELEKGVLTPHDFELATRFLPAGHRHWPAIYGVGTAGAALGYGTSIARPRWSHTKLVWVSGSATLLGMVFGQLRQVIAHRQFTEALENPAGFIEALRNVDRRLGGDGHLGFTLERIRNEAVRADDTVASGRNREHGPEMVNEENWEKTGTASNAPHGDRFSPSSSTKEPLGGNTCSEFTNKLPSSTSSQSNGPPSSATDDRATEQAKFDAILEAERWKGRSE